MGIQINGNTDNISATDGGLTVSDLELNQTGVSTFHSHLHVADQIIHLDDDNSKIRFPAADTITAETAGTERLRITSTGEVKIMNTSGTVGLYFQSSSGAVSNFRAIGTNNQSLGYFFGNSERVRFSSDGKVGIGTITPGTTLHLSSATPVIRLTDTDTAGPLHCDIESASGDLYLDTGSVHRDVIITSVGKTNEIARFTGDGKVGIGTNNPTLNGNEEGIHIVSDDYPTVHLTNQTTGHAANNGSMFTLNNTGETIIRNGHASHIRFDTNNGSSIGERIRIDSSGNFIVNNTTAAAGGYTYKSLVSDQITSSEQTFGIQYLAVVTYGLNAESNGSFTIKKDGTERLRILSSGPHLLLGGTSSVNEITESSSNSGLVIGNTSNGNGGLAIINSTTGTGRIYFGDATGSDTARNRGQINYYHNGDYMMFATAGSERLRIRSDGKISTGTSINTSNTYEFSVTGADGTGGFYAHGRNHYLSNRSNAYASLTLKKSNADSDGVDYLQLRDSSNALKLSLSGDGSINGDTNSVKVKVSGGERLRVNSGSVWVIGGTSGMPTSSSGARLQVGAHTFTGSNHVYHTSRLGIQNNGSLTCISNCSTYTDVTYPGYGFVMVQGASTSDYNTFGICPDSPQTGSDLNFHSGYRKSNIHSDANVRQMWINMSGQVYKRDNGANWNQTSDERLKKNIVDNNIGLAEIKRLRITSFEYRKADEIDMSLFPKANDPLQVIIEGEEGPHTGVIAQEIESVFPECVKTSDKGAKTVQADAITWALVNAVKELSAKNDALEERIKNLEGS